jgi:hypothetical protein
MAKKSKNKRKKLANERNNGGGKRALGASLRQAGAVATVALVGEIVEATVERLVQRASRSKTAKGNHNSSDHPSKHHEQGMIAEATSTLQDGIERAKDIKPTVRDAAGAAKDSLDDIRPTLNDVADSLKEAAQETIQQSLAVANPADMTLESVVDTAKNVISAVSLTDSGKSDKKGKKKSKKKKKKKS